MSWIPSIVVGVAALAGRQSRVEAQILSVDFGHEFLKVALMRQNAPLEIVLNTHSKRKTTTAISFLESTRTFGDDAMAHQGKAPSKVPMFFHSTVGVNYTAADVQEGGKWWSDFGLGSRFYSHTLGYDVERGVPTFQIGEGGIYGEELLAHVFFFAKKMADESVEGQKAINVRELAVTLPAEATQRQRQAIIAAGEVAGLRVQTLVHESSAFAVHRAVDYSPEEENKTEHALYINIGSRKAEAMVVRLEARSAGMVKGKTAPVVTVTGSAVDYRLGGHLMDLKLAEVMLKRFQEKFPKLADGIAKNPRALRKLLAQAQKTKMVLSSNKQAGFTVESLFEDTDFQATVKREEFEEMCVDMFATITDPIQKALVESNLTFKEINHIEVVGGAWRVPKVQQILSDYIEKEKGEKMLLGQHLNGEEAGALGTALIAANSSSSFRVRKIFFADRSKHEYAVKVVSPTGEWERNLTTLYPAGSALGGKKKLALELLEDFNVLLFENGNLISEHQVTGLQDLLADQWKGYNMTGTPKVTTTVALDNNGMVEIKAPVATVEDNFWVNVSVPKLKPLPNLTATFLNSSNDNASAENATPEDGKAESGSEGDSWQDPEEQEPKEEDPKEGEPREEPKDETQGEPKEESEEPKPADGEGEAPIPEDGVNASVNDSFATNTTAEPALPEYDVVQKLKKKKHDKKLTIVRKDYSPLPLSAAQVEELKLKLQQQAEHELEVMAIASIKNELEASIYSSRDTMDREDVQKVTTEQQREEVSKLAADLEEWMFEPGATKVDYDTKLQSLKDLLSPMEERASEFEARENVEEAVVAAVEKAELAAVTIAKDMPWVNQTKVEAAKTKQDEFSEWYAKRKEMQAKLPLHEAPAFTAKEVTDELAKVVKDWEKLQKTKKPKEKKEKKAKNATDSTAGGKAQKMPVDIAATEVELESARAKKQESVGKEDFDAAHLYKEREIALKAHLEKLQAEPTKEDEAHAAPEADAPQTEGEEKVAPDTEIAGEGEDTASKTTGDADTAGKTEL